MISVKKILSVCAAAALTVGTAAAFPTETTYAEGKTMIVKIDGSKAANEENKLYRGLGMVSANNTSRLLLDYKAEQPERYEELLNYMFGKDGIGLTHLKLEMGADINSSSGTEPSVMRYEDEKADVTRGAGYQLAADAKKINPELTLDMLWWSEPRWVSTSDDVNAARYKWYKETLCAAYETYGLEFEYVSANQNEKGLDIEWIKYLSSHLKAEKDCPYDFSKIKIVAADEVTSWRISEEMLYDEELMNSVDVIGSHYSSWSDENTMKLMNKYGKEIWFSEASSPMSYSKGTYKYDGNGSGLGDLNGILDIANRIITMYPGGGMTLHELQPVISSYYDGATYSHKQLITANEPWSGYYQLDNGFYMALHFSQFFKKGWAFIDGACAGDGEKGGDGHCIQNAVYSYMTAADMSSGDYSCVITNTTSEPISYSFEVSNLDKARESVDVWETKGPNGGRYDDNYYKKVNTIIPEKGNGGYVYSITVKPYSMITVSTLKAEEKDYPAPSEGERKILSLPYSDDFEYNGYPEDYLSSRGFAPRYTTDEAGAFEVENIDGNNILVQKINKEIRAFEWNGSFPAAVTNFGDDAWFNYSVSADVRFSPSDKPEDNFVGAGLRYNLASELFSGYWIKLFENGSWELYQGKDKEALASGRIENFASDQWTRIKIEAVENTVKAYANGEQLCEYNAADDSRRALCAGGRAALYSSYNNNMFDNVKAEPADNSDPYIIRLDNTDDEFEYSDGWEHNTMAGFSNYKRTVSTGSDGAEVTLRFCGKGFSFTGSPGKKGAIIKIEADGAVQADNYKVNGGSRQCIYHLSGLERGEHTVKLTVLSGELRLDSAEISDEYEIKTMHSAAEIANEKSASGSEGNVKGSRFKAITAAAGAAAVIGVGTAAAAIIRKKKKTDKKS